jgi:hypothetical protein
MANTAESDWRPYHHKWLRGMGGGLAMMTENQDIAPLLALLKMAADQWPSCEECGLKPAGALALRSVNFRAG